MSQSIDIIPMHIDDTSAAQAFDLLRTVEGYSTSEIDPGGFVRSWTGHDDSSVHDARGLQHSGTDAADIVAETGQSVLDLVDCEYLLYRGDGFVIDSRTGEIVGSVEARSSRPIDTKEDVEYIQQKILRAQTTIDAREVERETVMENIGREIAQEQAVIKYLNRVYGSQIEAWYDREIVKQRGKSKTINTNYGTVSKRSSGGAVMVVDSDALIAWAAKEQVYEKVVVVKTEVSKSGIKEILKAGELKVPMSIAYLSPVTQEFSVDTGFVSTKEKLDKARKEAQKGR